MSKKSAAPGDKSKKLELFLASHGKIGVDTALFIYQVEENPRYIGLTHRVFEWIEAPSGLAVTSAITMLELLVHPYRHDDPDTADTFYALLSTYPNLEWCPLTLPIADEAARLGARHNLKTPDAVQAATALSGKATGFISNDPIFRRIEALEVLILDELV